MAKLYITEFNEFGKDTLGRLLMCGQEPGTDQSPLAIGGSSVQSSAFATDTRLVRIHTDAICSIAVGSNPTATANTRRMAAGQTEFLAVSGGQKIAVITNT